MTKDPRPTPEQYAKDAAKRENADNKAKQRYEEKAVKQSDVTGEVTPNQKLTPSQPDPTNPSNTEFDPRVNPHAPGGALEDK